jgi:mRNA deadenylase 3'-5' endonuclease subunit Ccr4
MVARLFKVLWSRQDILSHDKHPTIHSFDPIYCVACYILTSCLTKHVVVLGCNKRDRLTNQSSHAFCLLHMCKKRRISRVGLASLLFPLVENLLVLVVTPFTMGTTSPLLSSGIFVRGTGGDQQNQHSIFMSNNNDEDEEEEKPRKLIVGWDTIAEEDLVAEQQNNDFDEYCSVLDDFGCEAYEDVARNLDEKVDRWIRLEAQKDETLNTIETRKDVLTKIEQVRKRQEGYGPSQLYARQWRPKQAVPHGINGDGPQAVASFSVLQFNTLAEGLSSGPNVKTPFPVINKNNNDDDDDDKKQKKEQAFYGGFTQVDYPEICLDFALRRWRLVEVILGNCTNNDSEKEEGFFDILALEEVDRFRGFFAPVLRLFGYESIFMPKAKAPGVQLGFYSDGCALFWKASVFKLISEQRLNYKLGNQVLILATLDHIATGVPVVVVVTHLKAQKSDTNEKFRCMQVEEALEHAQSAATNEARRRGLKLEDINVLIMGDFNADPPSLMTFSDSSVDRILSNSITPMKFQSAYTIDPPPEDFFTTWKTRGTETVKRIIDYIFYSGHKIRCTEYLGVPKSEELEASKLPGLQYPSDHLMIGAKFDVFK